MDYAKEYDRIVEQSNYQQIQFEQLQAENEALKEELATWKQTAEAHKENFDILAGDLRMKLAAAQVDAERYRWLRENPPLELAVRKFPGETERGCYLDGGNLDAAIDESMKEKTE